jgi:hypothetical protein
VMLILQKSWRIFLSWCQWDEKRCKYSYSEECTHLEYGGMIDTTNYSPGTFVKPFSKRDVCLTRESICFDRHASSGEDESLTYCSRRRIVGFSFIWLDNLPLNVDYDAKTGKLTLH